jgi:hypothetical protein
MVDSLLNGIAVNQSSGHVWQGPYYSCPLDETHLWEALRYVELNPLRISLVASPEDWHWSSTGQEGGQEGGGKKGRGKKGRGKKGKKGARRDSLIRVVYLRRGENASDQAVPFPVVPFPVPWYLASGT